MTSLAQWAPCRTIDDAMVTPRTAGSTQVHRRVAGESIGENSRTTSPVHTVTATVWPEGKLPPCPEVVFPGSGRASSHFVPRVARTVTVTPAAATTAGRSERHSQHATVVAPTIGATSIVGRSPSTT